MRSVIIGLSEYIVGNNLRLVKGRVADTIQQFQLDGTETSVKVCHVVL